VPPLVGEAVNVTAEPVHAGLLLVETETEGVTLLTCIVIPDELAVAGVAQLALEVITQVTTAPLVSEELL
jgi:hypothetical protein